MCVCVFELVFNCPNNPHGKVLILAPDIEVIEPGGFGAVPKKQILESTNSKLSS